MTDTKTGTESAISPTTEKAVIKKALKSAVAAAGQVEIPEGLTQELESARLGMKDNHIQFCDHLAAMTLGGEQLNAKAAAAKAGVVSSSGLIARTDVQRYLSAIRAEIAWRAQNNRAVILALVTGNATFDPRSIYDPKTGRILPPVKWPDQAAAMLSSFESHIDKDGDTIVKVKLHDRKPYVEMMLKVMQLLGDVDASVLNQFIGDRVIRFPTKEPEGKEIDPAALATNVPADAAEQYGDDLTGPPPAEDVGVGQ